jgi:hypothetical protein
MKTHQFLCLFFVINFTSILAQYQVSEEAKELALKWAPLIWLHPEEKFFPVSPEFVIENMEVLTLFHSTHWPTNPSCSHLPNPAALRPTYITTLHLWSLV